MKFPPHLKPGDTVDIVAPAFGASEADVMTAVTFLQSWGLKARVPGDLLGKDLLCAADDETRARLLLDALTTTDSQAVWGLRGGYGCARLIPFLQTAPIPQTPKWFLGFSDHTVLHLWLTQQWHWPTLHATTLLRAAKGETDETSLTHLKKLLFRTIPELRYPLTHLNTDAKTLDSLTAPLTGGNLAVITSGIGTPWQIDTKDQILFLEEVDERGYRVDRMLLQLEQAGLLTGLKALILGDFSGGTEPDGSSFVWPTLQRFADTQPYPIYRCPGIGHERTNHPLPLGYACQLRKDTLRISLV